MCHNGLAQRFNRLILSENQGHIAAYTIDSIGLGRTVVNVGIRRHEEVVLLSPIDRQRIERRAVHHLHAVDQPVGIERVLGLGLLD